MVAQARHMFESNNFRQVAFTGELWFGFLPWVPTDLVRGFYHFWFTISGKFRNQATGGRMLNIPEPFADVSN
jgi:hypothetical protein